MWTTKITNNCDNVDQNHMVSPSNTDTPVVDTNNGEQCGMGQCNRINICTKFMQNDTGVNRSVTNNMNLLHNYKPIDPYSIGGVKADDVAIVCTGFGFLHWQSKEGRVLHIKSLYCKDVDGTIISPTTQHRISGF